MPNIGMLVVAPAMLTELFGLQTGHKVGFVSYDGHLRAFLVRVEGADMPQGNGEADAPDVSLRFHETVDTVSGLKTLEASWSHRPDVRWHLRGPCRCGRSEG